MADITTQLAKFGDTDNTLLLKIANASQGSTPAGTNNIGNVDVASVKGATSLSTTQVTVTGTAATVAIARPTRRGICFTNTHASASCWVGPETVTAGNGQKLPPGGSFPFTWVGLFEVIDDGVTHPVVCVSDEWD